MTEERVIDRGHNVPPDGVLPVLPGDATPEQVERAQQKALASAEEGGAATPAFDIKAHAALAAHVWVFCDAAGKWLDIKQIQNKEQAERLVDFVAGALALRKRVEDKRTEEKKRWDDLGKRVQEAFKPMASDDKKAPGKLDRVISAMREMQADWMSREAARVEAEKAEAARIARAKVEEAQLQAAAAAARNDFSSAVDAEAALKDAEKEVAAAEKPAKVSVGSASGAGRAMGWRTQAYAEITNIRQVFMHFQENPKVIEVLQSLADAEIRGGRDVPGAERKERKAVA